MKKIYFFLMAILATAVIARSQKTWIGPATGGSWASGTNWTGGTVPGAADDVVIGGGISGTINNVANVTVRTLTIDGNSNVTLDYSGGGGARTLTISSSAAAIDLSVTLGSQLTIAGTNFTGIALAQNADATIAGQLTINAGRNYNTGGGNSVTTVTGTIDNKGAIATSNGSLVFAAGGSYIHSQNGGVVPDATWNDAANCIITGVINQMPTGFNQEFGNFEWNSTTQVPFNAPNVPSFGGLLTNIDGNLTIKSTGTGAIYLANAFNFQTTVDGDYIQTGGTLVINQVSGAGNLSIQGNFNMSGGVLARNSPAGGGNSSTVIFSGDNVHTFTKTGGAITGAVDFEVGNDDSVDFGTSVLNGSTGAFRILSGAKFVTSNPAGLNSAGATGSIQTTTRTFSDEAIYEFRGAATGIFNTGGSTNTTASVVRGLIINNPAGSVTLSKPVTIADNGAGVQRLYLQNGALITTAANILTLNNNVQATGVAALNPNQYSLNSFVDGPLRKIGDNDFIFPVGKVGSGLHKIGIDLTNPLNNTTAFTAQYFRANPQTLSTTLAAGLEKLSGCEYWTLERSTGIAPVPARVILSWENNSTCNSGAYVTNFATLRVARLDATNTWVNEGFQAGSQTGNNTAGTIMSSNIVNTFSPFALASSSETSNPLPVVFGDVKAYEKNGDVQIEWSNLTEMDVAEYTIERSANGQDFTAIATQWPTSNQNDKVSYTSLDDVPAAGANYYRIKVVETTGKIVYSKILSVNLGRGNFGLQLYPNPVIGNQVTITLSNMRHGQYNVRMLNATGQDVFKKIIINQSSYLSQTLNLPSTIKPGVYHMLITAEDYRETKIFIVR